MHFLLPLAAAVLIEGAFAWWAGDFVHHFSLQRTMLILVPVLLVFGFVALYQLNSATSIRIRNLDSAILDKALHDAQSYFAIATIPLHDWFDPGAQVYFARLLSHRSARPSIRYERVLLFFRDANEKYLDSDYLDGYLAKALIEIHRRLGIPLAFLTRTHVHAILSKLSVSERAGLGFRWSRAGWWLLWRRRVRRALAFVVVGDSQGKQTVFLFHKHGPVVETEEISDPDRMQPYLTVAERIRALTHDAKGNVKVQHDFTLYYQHDMSTYTDPKSVRP